MSKIVTSPVTEFPGTITLDDKPSMPKLKRYLRIMLKKEGGKPDPNAPAEGSDEENRLVFDEICSWVETWNIQGQPEKPTHDTFVAAPIFAATALIVWIRSEIFEIIYGEQVIPKASRLPPMPMPSNPAKRISRMISIFFKRFINTASMQ